MRFKFFDNALTVFDAGLNGHTFLPFFFQHDFLSGFIHSRKGVYSRHDVTPMRVNTIVIANETSCFNLYLTKKVEKKC